MHGTAGSPADLVMERGHGMLKYGIVGAVAMAVLVAALWDGKKKNKDEVAKAAPKAEDSAITGDMGGARASDPKPVAPPQTVDPGPAKPVEDCLEKYQVQRGDKLKAIAKKWLGDENLFKDLYEAN